MTAAAKKLLQDVLALPEDERRRIVDALTNSLSVAKEELDMEAHLNASVEDNRELYSRLAK